MQCVLFACMVSFLIQKLRSKAFKKLLFFSYNPLIFHKRFVLSPGVNHGEKFLNFEPLKIVWTETKSCCNHSAKSPLCEERNELQMKETIFMRFSFGKIHCPLLCFCRPSAAHLCTSWPLKLDERPDMVHSIVHAVLDVPNKGNTGVVKEEHVNGKHEHRRTLRSCIRQLPDASRSACKKKVQWTDNFGKELAEIKEFESSETGESGGEEESRCCLCVIL